MAMEQGDREKKQGGQELSVAKSGENAPGMEGRAPTQAAMPPMVADLSQVEQQLAAMPAMESSSAQVEGKLDVPQGKGGGAGEAAGPEGAGGGGAKEESGGAGSAEEGAGREEKAKAEGKEKEEAQGAADAEVAGKEAKRGEGAAPEAGPGKQGAQVDPGPLRALEGVFGADFGDVKLVIDDAKTAAAGASALVEQAGEIVLSSAEVVDGKVNPSLLAHEATHLMHLRNAQGKGGGNPSGAEAPGGDMRPSRPEDLEKEARTAATAALGGNPFDVAGRARPGSAMLNPAGADPAAGAPATEEKKKLPSTQALKFHLADVTVNLPAREVPTGSETKVQATVGTKPDWLILNNIYLRYDGDKLKGGAATYRINPAEENRYIRLNKAGGSDLTRLNIDFDERGNSKDPGALPAMRLKAQGLGEIEVTDIGIDEGGMKFNAKLTSKELTALASKLVGAELQGGAIDIKRSKGKINVAGDSEFGVSLGGRQLASGKLKITTRGEAYEGKAELELNSQSRVLRGIKLEGKYTVEKGVEASAAAGALGNLPGGKFSISGELKVLYKSGGASKESQAAKGFSFSGGLAASLKVSDKLAFEGSAVAGFFSEKGGMRPGIKGQLKGNFKPNKNLEITGEISAEHYFDDEQVKAKGEPSAKFFNNYTVKMPLKYDSQGTPQWKVTPTFEIDNLSLGKAEGSKGGSLMGRFDPNKSGLVKKIAPKLPRLSIPLFGPLVIEGGINFNAEAGIEPRLDKLSLSAELDVDKGFDFKKANLKGKLVCPFYAEAAVGVMVGLGVNFYVADAGAGIEGRGRVSLPKGEDKNAFTSEINADLTAQGSGADLKVSSNFDLKANLDVALDLNLYARYDTVFSREKIYRHTLKSWKLFTFSPTAKGGLDFSTTDGIQAKGVEFKLPEPGGLAAGWVKQQFEPIRKWF